jgi:hypothetical protein
VSRYQDIWNAPDEIYFEQFKHLIKPPPDPGERQARNTQPEDVYVLQQQKLETFFAQLLTRLEELSRAQQLQSRQPKPTSALYLGRRVTTRRD